jgi:hypothetical protein
MVLVYASTLREKEELMCFKLQNRNSILEKDKVLKEIKERYGIELHDLIKYMVIFEEKDRKFPLDLKRF